MPKILLTGGSGFIAAHILDQLLAKGHQVVTTVRSEEKAQKIREAYPHKGKDDLAIVIVPDIAKPDAFDEVLKIPNIEVVLHTASPFHFKFTDPKTELVDPALIGTTSILRAIVKFAPSIKRVVVTSSFAAIVDEAHMKDPNTTFTETSWNPVTIEQIYDNPASAYRASKKLAEKAAWDFVNDKANGAHFDIATINPPLVLGPVLHHLANLDSINTSNGFIARCIAGQSKQEIPPTRALNWVDVRDVALAHIKAGIEIPEAGGKRFFTTASYFSNREVVDAIRKNFPALHDKLPGENIEGGEFPPENQYYKYDNSKTNEILGIDYIPLEKSVVDTVKSLEPFL